MIAVGHRHAAGVDESAGKGMALGQADGGAAEDAFHAIGWAQEAGGAVGHPHVFGGGFVAFFVVAL